MCCSAVPAGRVPEQSTSLPPAQGMRLFLHLHRGEKGQEAKMAAAILQLCLLLYEWQVYSFFLFSCSAKTTEAFYDHANFLSVQGVIKFFFIYSLSQKGSGSGVGDF